MRSKRPSLPSGPALLARPFSGHRKRPVACTQGANAPRTPTPVPVRPLGLPVARTAAHAPRACRDLPRLLECGSSLMQASRQHAGRRLRRLQRAGTPPAHRSDRVPGGQRPLARCAPPALMPAALGCVLRTPPSARRLQANGTPAPQRRGANDQIGSRSGLPGPQPSRQPAARPGTPAASAPADGPRSAIFTAHAPRLGGVGSLRAQASPGCARVPAGLAPGPSTHSARCPPGRRYAPAFQGTAPNAGTPKPTATSGGGSTSCASENFHSSAAGQLSSDCGFPST